MPANDEPLLRTDKDAFRIENLTVESIRASLGNFAALYSSAKPSSEHESVSTFGKSMGLLYKVWTLDCVATIGHAISLDFSDRPELYQGPPADIATALVLLQGSYGFHAYLPDIAMRQRLMKPIFGQSDGQTTGSENSEFHAYRLPVLMAAAGFSENAQPITFPQLRERVRNTIVPFRTHLADLEGASFFQTGERMLFNFCLAKEILKSPSISAVFGINGEIDTAWPLESTSTDARGAKLIEKITTQLRDLPYGVISREMFVHMQRIGEKGFQSISRILDLKTDDPEFGIDSLITELYAWGGELRLVGGARPQQTGGMQPQQMAPQKGPMTLTPLLEASSSR